MGPYLIASALGLAVALVIRTVVLRRRPVTVGADEIEAPDVIPDADEDPELAYSFEPDEYEDEEEDDDSGIGDLIEDVFTEEPEVIEPEGQFDYPRGLGVYAPRTPEAVALFRAAAEYAGLPLEWADVDSGLHDILAKESRGYVGVLNYTYLPRSKNPKNWPAIWAELRQGRMTGARITKGPSAGLRSSASGLGQITLSNLRLRKEDLRPPDDRLKPLINDGAYAYYPDGPAGIGDPFNEAVGMLRYIYGRYGSPQIAWQKYNKAHEGY